MQVNVKIRDIPRPDLLARFQFHGSWPGANIMAVGHVKKGETSFEFDVTLPILENARELLTTDAIYVTTEVRIRETPTTHGHAAFNLGELMKNVGNADERYNYSLERKFSDYHTADEKRKLYGKVLLTILNPEEIQICPSPYMSHEEMKVHSQRWCEQKAAYWSQYAPAAPGLENIVLKHFISPNGYVFPPEMFTTLIMAPLSYNTLHSSLIYSLYVWQLGIDVFVSTVQKLGTKKMSTWTEFIAYNAIGFALELFSLRLIYRTDEDIDLETGAIESTERMEVFVATLFSDCEEKGRKILRVVHSFLEQVGRFDTISMDPLMLVMISFLRNYVTLMTTNSTNDSALDKNNKLNQNIEGAETNGHVTAILIPKLKFYRRHAKLHHVHNWSDIYASIDEDRPYYEVLCLEGTGFQSALLNIFNNYITTGSEACRENIAKVKSLLENSPLSKIMSSFIFNMDFALAPRRTPNGFIRYITSGYNYDAKDPLRQCEFRPFNSSLRYGVTLYELLNEDVFWVPCMPFDDNVIREMLYQLEHFGRGLPFKFTEPSQKLPTFHKRGSPDTNGCSTAMIQSFDNLSITDIVDMNTFLTQSAEFQHFDFKVIPMGEQSLLVVRITPINPKEKLKDISTWFARNVGSPAKLVFLRWAEATGNKPHFELVFTDLSQATEYSIILSLQNVNRQHIELLYRSLSEINNKEHVNVSFPNGFRMVSTFGSRTVFVPEAHIFDIQFRERKIQQATQTPIRSSFGQYPAFTPTFINDEFAKCIFYEDVVGNEVRQISLPYVMIVEPPKQQTPPTVAQLTYNAAKNQVTLPNNAVVTIPPKAMAPDVIHYPVENVDMSVKKEDAAGAAAIKLNDDGSITVNTFKVLEEIYTKRVYRFANMAALKKAFPPKFRATAYCIRITSRIVVASFFIGLDPFVLEIMLAAPTPNAPKVDQGVLELREGGALVLAGMPIPETASGFIVNDPLVTLCGMMINPNEPVEVWDTPALTLKARTGKTIFKTFRRPAMMVEAFGNAAIICRNVKYNAKLGVISMELEKSEKYYRSFVFDLKTAPRDSDLRLLKFSSDAIYFNGRLHPYPNELLYICGTDPITDEELNTFEHLIPALEVDTTPDDKLVIIGDCVNVAKNIFVAYNDTSLIVYNDLMEQLFLMEMDNEVILMFDFTDCDQQFVKIEGNRFSFNLNLHSSQHLSWPNFFRTLYDSTHINAERGEIVHHLNEFAAHSKVVSTRRIKEYDANNYFAMIGAALWVYERSPADFYELQQILNIDEWLHDGKTTWDDKMLFIFNLWGTNINNRNYAIEQNFMLANVRLAVRDLRI